MKMKLASAFILNVVTVSAGSSPSLRSSETNPNEATLVSSKCPVFSKYPGNDKVLQEEMRAATKPCGHYKSQGCQYEVIPANVDFPGEGVGELQYKPYIVQFDIGVHNSIKDKVVHSWNGHSVPKERTIGKPGSETCLELIVEGGSDATGYCAGMCGSGCKGFGYAKDCLKHDVCIAYKALKLMESDTSMVWNDYDDGFCYDVDCGDEAAQAILNCWIPRWGMDTPIICDENEFNQCSRASPWSWWSWSNCWPRRYGHWSWGTKMFNEGPCYNFQGWASGQGLPNNNQISNSYDFIEYLRIQGVEVPEEEFWHVRTGQDPEEPAEEPAQDNCNTLREELYSCFVEPGAEYNCESCIVGDTDPSEAASCDRFGAMCASIGSCEEECGACINQVAPYVKCEIEQLQCDVGASCNIFGEEAVEVA